MTAKNHPLNPTEVEKLNRLSQQMIPRGEAKAMAEHVGVSESYMRGMANPNDTEHSWQVTRWVNAQLYLGDFTPLQYVNTLCGYVSLPIPKPSGKPLNNLLMEMVVEMGQVLQVYLEAIRDEEITPDEVFKIQKELMDVVAKQQEVSAAAQEQGSRPILLKKQA